MAMPRGTGLRERKRLQTHDALAQAALQLFAERGFDAVTVADIAAAADVSVKTAFNYFPRKENFILDRREEIEAELLLAVRQRQVGEPVVAVVRRHTLEIAAHLNTVAPERRQAIRKVIESSPSVHARLRQVSLDTEQALAMLLVEDTNARPGDPTPIVVASTLGTMARLAYGVPGWPTGTTLTFEQVIEGINAAFDVLEAGLLTYATKIGMQSCS